MPGSLRQKQVLEEDLTSESVSAVYARRNQGCRVECEIKTLHRVTHSRGQSPQGSVRAIKVEGRRCCTAAGLPFTRHSSTLSPAGPWTAVGALAPSGWRAVLLGLRGHTIPGLGTAGSIRGQCSFGPSWSSLGQGCPRGRGGTCGRGLCTDTQSEDAEALGSVFTTPGVTG